MRDKQVMKAFQSQLPLISQCKQHLARHETQFAFSMANRVAQDQGEAHSTSFYEATIPVREIMRKKVTQPVLELVH